MTPATIQSRVLASYRNSEKSNMNIYSNEYTKHILVLWNVTLSTNKTKYLSPTIDTHKVLNL